MSEPESAPNLDALESDEAMPKRCARHHCPAAPGRPCQLQTHDRQTRTWRT